MRVPEGNDRDAREIIKAGHKLICPVCSCKLFWSGKTTLRFIKDTFPINFLRGMKDATNYVCDRCGYIFWFFE